MLEETQDHEEIIERDAALDIGKAEVVACVRVFQRGKTDTFLGERYRRIARRRARRRRSSRSAARSWSSSGT